MSIISLLRLGEWVKVFNDTFCIVYLALIYDCWRPHWYLQPFISILFQFYHHVGQFYCLEKPEYSEKTIVLSQVTEQMYHIQLYRVHLVMSGIQTLSISGGKHWLHLYWEIALPNDDDYNVSLVPIDERMLWNVYLAGCYASCARVHVIIKHEYHNKMYAFAFLLRWESQKINRPISVSQIVCSIQTAINPINFILLFTSGEWNTMLWTGHFI